MLHITMSQLHASRAPRSNPFPHSFSATFHSHLHSKPPHQHPSILMSLPLHISGCSRSSVPQKRAFPSDSAATVEAGLNFDCGGVFYSPHSNCTLSQTRRLFSLVHSVPRLSSARCVYAPHRPRLVDRSCTRSRVLGLLLRMWRPLTALSCALTPPSLPLPPTPPPPKIQPHASLWLPRKHRVRSAAQPQPTLSHPTHTPPPAPSPHAT